MIALAGVANRELSSLARHTKTNGLSGQNAQFGWNASMRVVRNDLIHRSALVQSLASQISISSRLVFAAQMAHETRRSPEGRLPTFTIRFCRVCHYCTLRAISYTLNHMPGSSSARKQKSNVPIAALLILNLLNHTDRNLLAGAQPVMQSALGLSDSRVGTLTSGFFTAYMIAGPCLGWLGDRYSRRRLTAITVCAWSICLALAAACNNVQCFLLAYLCVAAAEAAFGVYTVTLLSDYFPDARSTRALGLFFMMMVLGRSLGHILGGFLAGVLDWKAPFRIMSPLGLVLGVAALWALSDPERGPANDVVLARPGTRVRPTPWLLQRAYVLAVLGLAMQTFAAGGLATWLPTYLYRYAGYSPARAATLTGMATFGAGVAGTWLGGTWSEALLRGGTRRLYWMSSLSLLLAAPCVAIILFTRPSVAILGILGTQFFLFLNLSPLNLLLLRSVSTEVRSTAVAFALFVIHLLGDAPSPQLIGLMSDAVGLRAGLALVIGALLAGASLLALA